MAHAKPGVKIKAEHVPAAAKHIRRAERTRFWKRHRRVEKEELRGFVFDRSDDLDQEVQER